MALYQLQSNGYTGRHPVPFSPHTCMFHLKRHMDEPICFSTEIWDIPANTISEVPAEKTNAYLIDKKYKHIASLVIDFDGGFLKPNTSSKRDQEKMKRMSPAEIQAHNDACAARLMPKIRQMASYMFANFQEGQDFVWHFSGAGGFHLIIPYYRFCLEMRRPEENGATMNMSNLNFALRLIANAGLAEDDIDQSIYRADRILRAAYSLNERSGLHACMVDAEMLLWSDWPDILHYSKQLEYLPTPDPERIQNPALEKMFGESMMTRARQMIKVERTMGPKRKAKFKCSCSEFFANYYYDLRGEEGLQNRFVDQLPFVNAVGYTDGLDGVSRFFDILARNVGKNSGDEWFQAWKTQYQKYPHSCTGKIDEATGRAIAGTRSRLNQLIHSSVHHLPEGFHCNKDCPFFDQVNRATKASLGEINNFALEYAKINKIISSGGTLYSYTDGIYTLADEAKVKQDFADWLTHEHYMPKRVTDMMHYIADKRNVIIKNNYQTEVLMKNNKVLNITDFTLRDLTEDDIFFNKLNATFNPEAKCELFEKFLNEIFLGRQAISKFIQEFMGYSFTPSTRFELALQFRGEGANGKGVLMKIWQYVIGAKNVSNIRLSQLRNEYMIVNLRNKLINMVYEVSAREAIDDELIKMLISGEPMEANIKYREPINFLPVAKFIVSSNNPLISQDRSEGYKRRWVVIPFDRDFKKEERDVNLIYRLQEEIDGIFMWALTGLKRVLTTNKIYLPEELQENTNREMQDTNPVFEFASNHLFWSLEEKHQFTSAQVVFNEYVKFCKLNNYQPVSYANFMRQLKRVASNKREFSDLTVKYPAYGFKNIWCREVPYNEYTKLYDPNKLVQINNDVETITKMSLKDFYHYKEFKL